MKVNEGEVPQYYVENSHEAIIAPDEWEAVQAEMQRRKALGTKYSGNSVLATWLVCADCGSFFGSKVWHSTSKYRRVIWQCNHKFIGGEKCKTLGFIITSIFIVIAVVIFKAEYNINIEINNLFNTSLGVIDNDEVKCENMYKFLFRDTRGMIAAKRRRKMPQFAKNH